MILKAALFDLDGTLLDTEALSDKAILSVFRPFLSEKRLLELNCQLLPWECKKQLIGLRGEEWTPIMIQYAKDHWIDDGNCNDDDNNDILDNDHHDNDHHDNDPNDDDDRTSTWPTPQELLIQWEHSLQEYCMKEVEACPGAFQLVKYLASIPIPMAIATSSRSTSVMCKRTRHESLFANIPVIVTGDDPELKHGKPAPDIYQLAAKRLGVDPKECIVFEDALSGVRSGKAAGCTVVAIPNVHCQYTSEERNIFHQEADIVLTSLCDWNDALEEENEICWKSK